jgi:dinuclear metal center YbgI/SA1388 family protein
MLKRDKLITFIYKTLGEDILDRALVKDDFANGLQILGSEKVKRVAIGVSLNEEFLLEAIDWGAEFCIFHHGIYAPAYKLQYLKSEQKRLRLIFQNNLTIVGLHYALDAHPKLGNNAQIIKKLGAKLTDQFAEEWGYIGEFEKPQDLHDLGHKCQELFDHEVFVVQANNKKIKRIGVCSGSHKPGSFDYYKMQEKKIDLLITGETAEHIPHQMQEEGINYFVCGHYATEKFGIEALGDKIRTKYKEKLMVKFIDIKNPI